jgi:myo-inositol-1(or 4)-monophosphatase
VTTSAGNDAQNGTGDQSASDRSAFALDVARTVGHLLLESFRSGVAAERKARGIVTALDREAESLVAAKLAEAFPGDGLVSEEGAARPSSTGWRWIVDPLDGTTNFVSGLPLFTVSLAAHHDEGGVRVALVHAPALGSTFWAVRGRGARGDAGPLAPSPTARLDEAVFLINKAYAPAPRLWEVTAGLLPAIRAARMLGCVSLDLALVAAGWADGAVLLPADPWDVAAGALLVAEAGGRVSDLGGRPLGIMGAGERTGVLAATPALHAPALAKLSPFQGEDAR